MPDKVKVLIVDSEHESRIICQNKLKYFGFEVVGSTDDPIIALEMIKSCQPNVVLFDVMLEKLDGIAFLSRAMALECKQKIHYIAITAMASVAIIKKLVYIGADYCMVKPVEYEILKERIMQFFDPDYKNSNDAKQVREITIDSSEKLEKRPQPEDIEKQVTSTILEIGIPAHVKGYYYVRTAIIMAIQNPDAINAVTKVIYPTIAKQYKTTSSRVERAIRHAIEVAWDRGNVDTLNGIFGYSINRSRGKPTNSEFVAMISDKLRLMNRMSNNLIHEFK